jgi:hypothetical protein
MYVCCIFCFIISAELTPGENASAPRFVQKLQPKHAPDGTTVQFECQIEGNPRPQITWFKETAIILPSQDFQVRIQVQVCCLSPCPYLLFFVFLSFLLSVNP